VSCRFCRRELTAAISRDTWAATCSLAKMADLLLLGTGLVGTTLLYSRKKDGLSRMVRAQLNIALSENRLDSMINNF
jgi:hypothetical protein